jgi:hypothetical protein
MRFLFLITLVGLQACSVTPEQAFSDRMRELSQEAVSCTGLQNECYRQMRWICQNSYVIDYAMSSISSELDPQTGKVVMTKPEATFVFRCV